MCLHACVSVCLSEIRNPKRDPKPETKHETLNTKPETDRLPGLGPEREYTRAFPVPFYVKPPSDEEVCVCVCVWSGVVLRETALRRGGDALTVRGAPS
jgi:hypothetical protein